MSTTSGNGEAARATRLLLAVFTPLAAWGAHLGVGYLLVTIHCVEGLPGFPVWMTALTLVLLGIVAWSGITTYRTWRAIGGIWETGTNGVRSRDSFLALLAVMLSPLFGLAIIFGAAPFLTLAPCAR